MTLIIGGLCAGQALHISPTDPIAVQIGLLLGAIAGLGGGYFNRSVIWMLPIQGRKVFLNRLEQSVQSLGLGLLEEEPASEAANVATPTPLLARVYGATGLGSTFSGRLYVNVYQDTAEIMGRAATIKKLKLML
ncbi:MAG: hypothetical protein HC857_13645 [Synechococcales cyanobacterium RU_4_20]|nr:hypothetical protein [Synechococcales cyanobacterium RU_4_20]